MGGNSQNDVISDLFIKPVIFDFYDQGQMTQSLSRVLNGIVLGLMLCAGFPAYLQTKGSMQIPLIFPG